MKNIPFYIILALVLLGVGCDASPKASVTESVPATQTFESTDLAKVILKPKHETLDVTRDPFKPVTTALRGTNESVVESDVAIQNIKLLGVTKINDEFRALLVIDAKKGVYKVDDVIKQYTITEIDKNQIILRNGTKNITLKRGN